ncbi:MAG: hypothetical protein PHQ33_07215, partial [Bacteroidales bacterium]|nr:hypothetical protein [Bacteroidales bacterium]
EVVVASDGQGYVSTLGNNDIQCFNNLIFKILPYDCNNLDSITMDGERFSPEFVFVNDTICFTLYNITANHQIFVHFKRNPRLFTQRLIINNEVVNETRNSIFCHQDTTVFIPQEECVRIDNIYINNENVGISTSYNFTDIMSDVEIVIYAQHATYNMDVTQSQNGIISSDVAIQVRCGDTITYHFTPDEGAIVANLIIDGDTLAGDTTYTFENVRESHTIAAIFSPNTYEITVNNGEGGIITPNTSIVEYGDSLRFNIIPDDCYIIDSLVVDGFYKGSDSTFLFENITNNHTISVTFKMLRDTFALVAGEHGQVLPSGDSIVDCGDSLIYTIIPDECYQIGNVWVDGVWHNELVENTENGYLLPFRNLSDDTSHTISVTFEPIAYIFEASTNGGGTVSPMFSMPLCGSDFEFSIDEASCYEIDSVWINNVYIPLEEFLFVGNNAHYTIQNVRRDHQIYVKFKDKPYHLTIDNREGGMISISDADIVCGTDVPFYIFPDVCNAVDSVWLNGNCINHLLNYHDNVISYLPDTAYYTITNFSQDNHLLITYTDAPQREIVQSYFYDDELISETITRVDCGTDTTLSLNYACYYVDSVWLDGIYQGNNNELLLTEIIDNHVVTIKLSIYQYTLTASATTNGTITPSDTNIVNCGDNFTFTISPNVDYYTRNLIIDGDTISGSNTYTFHNVQSDHTIGAVFDTYTYTVTSNAEAGGSILPESAFVDLGDAVTLQIIPDSCHSIDSVWLDGIYQGNIDMVSVTNIAENHHIRASFSSFEYNITTTNSNGGTISPIGIHTIFCGNDTTFRIVPDEGYHIENLIVDYDTIQGDSIYTFTGVTENHTLSAIFQINSYEVSAIAGVGGTIAPTSQFVNYGEDATLQITSDDCYFIDSVWLDGIYQGNDAEILLTNITDNQIVEVTFAQYQYTVSVSNPTNGTITPSRINTVTCGENLTLTVTPNQGYSIANLIVDGVTLPGNSSYTFFDIRENHTFDATFRVNTFTISTHAGQGGITIPETVIVNYGDDLYVTIIPDDCYFIDSVWLDGAYVGNDVEVPLLNISENHVVTATFAQYQYTVSVSNPTNGTITPSGINNVTCGENFTLTITPNSGYFVDSLMIDGVAVAGNTSFSFNDVRENHTFGAVFDTYSYEITTIAGVGGTISPTSQWMDYGEDATLQITPDDCYFIDSVWLDGIYQGNDAEIVLTNITDNHVVEVTFAQYQY